MDTTRNRVRLNFKAIKIATAVALIAAPLWFLLRSLPTKSVRREVIAQANELEKDGNKLLAIRHLDRFLENNPDDIEVLDLVAKLSSESAQSPPELLAATKYYERILRLAPGGEDRRDTQRQLVELYIRYGDFYRLMVSRAEPADYTPSYLSAEEIATRLISADSKSDGDKKKAAGDYKLLGMAQEGLSGSGRTAKLAEAVRAYENAQKLYPGDLAVAERLSRIYQSRLEERDRALEVLDALVKAKAEEFQEKTRSVEELSRNAEGGSASDESKQKLKEAKQALTKTTTEAAEARLIRFGYFTRLRDFDKAKAELDTAIKLAPGNPNILLTAAGEALRRSDTAAARQLLASLPEEAKGNLRVRLLRGMVELGDQKNDDAISLWRNDLILSGGTDAEMTWWLTFIMLKLNRLAEAKPLLTQYRRIAGDGDLQPRVQFLQGLMDLRSGFPSRAVATLDRAQDRLPEEFQDKVWMALGQGYEELGDQAKALDAYQRASEKLPEAPAPRLAAASLLQDRRIDEAIDVLNRGLEAAPREPQLRIALAGLLLKQQTLVPPSRRNWAAFDQALKQAEEVAPGNPSIALLSADRMMLAGQSGRATGSLGELAEKTPKNLSIWLAWAESLARTNQIPEALRVLERAGGPGGLGDKAALRIAKSKLLVAMHRGVAAAQVLKKGAEKLPIDERAAVAEALGTLQASQGDTASAKVAYAEWASILPDDIRPSLALLKLALDTRSEADLAAAVASLERVVKAGKVSDDPAAREAAPAARSSTGNLPAEQAKALGLVDEVLAGSPRQPLAHLVRARLLEQGRQNTEAIAAYRTAWDNGAQDALRRLIEMLVAEKKFDELATLDRGQNARTRRILAETFLQAGQDGLAGQFVEKAAEIDADTLEAANWQAQMYVRLKKADKAEANLKAYAERHKSELDPWLSLLTIQAVHKKPEAIKQTMARIKADVKADNPKLLEARCARAIGDVNAASAAYRAAAEAAPTDQAIRVEAATFFQVINRPAEAVKYLEGTPKTTPGYRAVARQVALAISAEIAGISNKDDAQKFWDNVWGLLGDEDPDVEDPEDRLIRAVLISRSPDPARRDTANGLLEALIADLPADYPAAVGAREYLAKSLLIAGNAKKASEVAAVNASLGADPAAIGLYAEALYNAGELDEAGRQLDRLHALKPGDTTEAFVRARLVRDRATPGQASADLQAAYKERAGKPDAEPFGRYAVELLADPNLGKTPEDVAKNLAAAEVIARDLARARPEISWVPAKILLAQKRFDEALAVVKPSAESDRAADRVEASRIALVAATSGAAETVETADRLVNEALKRDAKQADILIVSAMIKHLQGRYADEVALYKTVLEMAPENPIAANNMAWALSEGVDKPADGLNVIDQTIRQVGPLPQLLDTRGAILTRLGRYDDAIKDLEIAAQDSPVRLFHLARVYQKAGRLSEARKAMEAAKKNGLTADRLEPFERADMQDLLNL